MCVVAGVRHCLQAVQPPVRGAPAAGVSLRVLRRDLQEHEAAAGPQAGVAHRAVRGQQEGQPAAADPLFLNPRPNICIAAMLVGWY